MGWFSCLTPHMEYKARLLPLAGQAEQVWYGSHGPLHIDLDYLHRWKPGHHMHSLSKQVRL